MYAIQPEERREETSGPAARGAGAAVAAARLAQSGWAALGIAGRLRPIRRLRALIARDAAALADAAAAGRPRACAETLPAEVLPLADACAFLEREAGRILGPRRLSPRGRPRWLFGTGIELRRDPLGVVLVVAPSNYPLFLPGVQLLQALTAGNAVLVKPAPGCAPPVLHLQRLLGEAGLPAGLLQILDEEPEAVRAAIRAGVDRVLLTGSAGTGRRVMADLAPRLTPATMELSGCDAAFVLPDADLAMTAAALAYGMRLNGGATCIAPRRAFVPHTLAEPLFTALTARLADAPAAPVPPAVAELAHRLLAEAAAAGCRLSAPAPPPDAAAIRPTVVADATPGLGLLDADLFAPVLAIVPVEDDADALTKAGHCRFALGASVFGEERAARRLAERIDAGCVTVNDLIAPTADPRLPFGGRHESGFGVTRGAEGLLELTALKAVVVRRGRFRPHFDPLGPDDAGLFLAYIRAAHGAGFAARLRAVAALVAALTKRRART